MNWLEIVLTVYGIIALVVLARNVFLCQRERARLKRSVGTDTTFSQYVPLLLKDSLLFPLLILWHGFGAWLKDLE